MSGTDVASELSIARDVALAPLTTLQLGGSAEHFVRATTRREVIEALRWAREASLDTRILGGGSNLVVRDEGVRGLVIQLATRGISLARGPGFTLLEVQAGEPWENVVTLALKEDLAGIECLTGIPGSTGATPIQNVGAYGQEVSECIEAVEVLDRKDLSLEWWTKADCEFAYRDSAFKRDPDRHVVLAVRFALTRHGKPQVRYAELARALAARSATPSLSEVAAVVRGLRASKSMLIDPSDENACSAGSFFTNPILSLERMAQVKERALAAGIVQHADEVPTYATQDAAHQKLAAGWLIEKAGIQKGTRRGPVGVSSKHSLSLVHHGGGSTRELLALADEVRAQVKRVFDVELIQEPVLW